MLRSLQRDFVVVLVLLAGALLLLVLLVLDFRGGMPMPPRTTEATVSTRFRPPEPLDERLFSTGAVVSPRPSAQLSDSFLTTYFQPAPKPVVQAPTTRTVKLTYLGFMQAGDGPRSAMVAEADQRLIVGVGSNLVANLWVAAIESESLIVTNASGATNALPFRTEAALEVPAQ